VNTEIYIRFKKLSHAKKITYLKIIFENLIDVSTRALDKGYRQAELIEVVEKGINKKLGIKVLLKGPLFKSKIETGATELYFVEK
jgi:hypothetical protein